MSTYRVAQRTRFTTVDRRSVNDDRLSFRARGVLVWLLDKPDDWTCDSETIARAGREGRDAVRTALRELEQFGYLQRERTRTELGHWSTSWAVFETPQTDNQCLEIRRWLPDAGESGPKERILIPKTETEETPLPPTGGSETSPVALPPSHPASWEAAFDVFWRDYPRKIGKPAARRAFTAKVAKPLDVNVLDAFRGLDAWVQFWRDDGTAEKHIPHPSTWLNQERWNDKPPPVTAKPQSKQSRSMDVIGRIAQGAI